ncbi:MAG: membrane protein insertase YidC [Alphaproteobacteria bacterium]
MEKNNIILAVILSVFILAGWQFVDNYRINGDIINFDRPAPLSVQNQAGQNQPNQNAGTALNPQANNINDPNDIGAPTLGNAGANSGGTLNNAFLSPAEIIAQDFNNQTRITIRNDRVSGSINLKGAKIDDLTLLDYRTSLDDNSDQVSLLSPAGQANSYFAEFGWVAAANITQRVTLPNSESLWQASSTSLTAGDPVILRWVSPEGVGFVQRISMDQDFLFTVTQEIEDNGVIGALISEGVSTYGRILRKGIPASLSQLYILHEGMIGFLEDGLQEIDYDEIAEEPNGVMRWNSTGGWVGITDKYWLAALVPDQTRNFTARMISKPTMPTGNLEDYLYQSDVMMPLASNQQTTHLFLGAKQTTLLDRYMDDLGFVNFDLAVDFGWFYFLTKPIFYALHWLHEKIGNFGVSILILTVFIKALLFPLANKSYKSMSKMKLLQPKMLELRERYKDDRTKLNQAMMDLYKNERVNPLAGCLPILVQIPIFFSLYKVLYVTIEMRHAPFFGWIQDLSAPDPLRLLNFFGFAPWDVPEFLAIINIGIWPILMGISMWAQMRLNPAPADPIQQKIFTFMPILFTFMLGNFAAGLVIYWTWNNVLSMSQQYIIMKRMGVAIGGGRDKTAS